MENSSFEYLCRTKTGFGKNALDHLPSDLSAMDAKKPFVITSKAVAQSGVTAHLIDAFKESGIILGIWDNALNDNLVDTLRDLTDLYNNKGFDAIIALGGGVVADLSKILNIIVSKGPHALKECKGTDNIDAPLKPLVYIPSGICTGRETSRYACVAEYAYDSQFLMPDIAVIDPRMFSKAPWEDMVNEALRSFTNCLESYAKEDNPLIRSYAYTALGVIMEALPNIMESDLPNNNQSQDQEHLPLLAKASVINGYLISNCDTLVCRPLGKMISEKCSAPEGVCMAIILPYVLEFLCKDRETGRILLPLAGIERYCAIPDTQRFGKVLFIIREIINDFFRISNGRVPRTLEEAGLKQEDLAGIVESMSKRTDIESKALALILDNAMSGRSMTSS
ncbi:MAG: iron-containing alcohol dehydrogenase [Desulfobacteraceae bacterium]|nr:iron-containing alcohol dehydrogenase [Desulfobacteraceae bacterium]